MNDEANAHPVTGYYEPTCQARQKDGSRCKRYATFAACGPTFFCGTHIKSYRAAPDDVMRQVYPEPAFDPRAVSIPWLMAVADMEAEQAKHKERQAAAYDTKAAILRRQAIEARARATHYRGILKGRMTYTPQEQEAPEGGSDGSAVG